MSKSLVEQLRSCARGIGLSLVDQAADRIEVLEAQLAAVPVAIPDPATPMPIEALAAYLPGDVNWGEPITPALVRHILDGVSQPALAQGERKPIHNCARLMREAGLPAPRTCMHCGLGPCNVAAPAQPETRKVLPSPARVTGEILHQAFHEFPAEKWQLPASRQAVWNRYAERVNARLAGGQS